jgi:hypothetical protein
MIILADHNLEGQAILLWGTLAAEGWLNLLSLRLVTLQDVSLPLDISDRELWRVAQMQQMILLTSNRRMAGEDSLEQTIREESTTASWPVLTIANVDRLDERAYRERCASRLVEVMIDIENYRGAGRIFIP